MRKGAFLGLCAVVLLAGCGGGDDSSSDSSGSGEIPVTLSDFKIDPSTLSPRDPGEITLSVINTGPSSHALEIEGNGVEEETETIGTGDRADLTVDLEPGTYEMYCPIGNHRAQGMEGTIVVRDESGTGGGTTTGDDSNDDSSSGGYGDG